MDYYTIKKNSFDKKEIQTVNNEDIKKFKPHAYTQPLPGAKSQDVIAWVRDKINIAYQYKRPLHDQWFKDLQLYATVPTTELLAMFRTPGGAKNVQKDIFIPPLIRTVVDLTAHFVTRQLFSIRPFVNFTNYASNNDALVKAQRLYERKLEGDNDKFGAEEKADEALVDFALFGNMVLEAEFHQERLLVEAPIDDAEDLDFDSILQPDENPLMEGLTEEEYISSLEADIESKIPEAPEPVPQFQIVDQYAKYTPVFLGHVFIDPLAANKDWRNAKYAGILKYMDTETLFDVFGDIPKFAREFKPDGGRSARAAYGAMAYGTSADPFLRNWFDENVLAIKRIGKNSSSANSDKIHSVMYFYTNKTETCIVDETYVVYHRYRDPKLVKMGKFPFEMIKYPSTSNTLFSVGLGHILRHLQKEAVVLATKRLKFMDEIFSVWIEYVGDLTDEQKVKRIGNVNFLEVEQPGAVNFRQPPPGLENIMLGPEERNMQRARQYAGIPAIADSSDTKSHLGNVAQRMEVAQYQFDTILNRVKSGFKHIYEKMHILNMTKLDGNLFVTGSTAIDERGQVSNVLTEDDLALLRTAPELTLEFTVGENVNGEKLKNASNILNTKVAEMAMAQLKPERLNLLFSYLLNKAGLDDMDTIFDTSEASIPPGQDLNGVMPIPGMEGQMPPPPGTIPQGAPVPPEMGGGLPPELLQQLQSQMGGGGGMPAPIMPPG